MTQLQMIVLDFRRGILAGRKSRGYCHAICAPLQAYLAILGYEAKLCEGWVDQPSGRGFGHYWLTLPDGEIIDPTADQFRYLKGYEKMPMVYIGPVPEGYRPGKLT